MLGRRSPRTEINLTNCFHFSSGKQTYYAGTIKNKMKDMIGWVYTTTTTTKNTRGNRRGGGIACVEKKP